MSNSLFVRSKWDELSLVDRDRALAELGCSLGSNFKYANSIKVKRRNIPLFLHKPSMLIMCLIFGDEFTMGMSRKEEAVAQKLFSECPFDAECAKPAHRVKINPFLISVQPISLGLAKKHLLVRNFRDRPSFGNGNDAVIYLERDESEKLAKKFDLEIQSEAQWEYCFRAGSPTLFPFGQTIPSRKKLEEIFLSRNSFGVCQMHTGEWCADTYINNYLHCTNTDRPRLAGSPFVVRGGAASYWPWQTKEEAVFCFSCARAPDQGLHSLRLVHRLSQK